jgi:hypothetical protein
MRARATVCRATLACRSPPRLRRWRVLPEHVHLGQPPAEAVDRHGDVDILVRVDTDDDLIDVDRGRHTFSLVQVVGDPPDLPDAPPGLIIDDLRDAAARSGRGRPRHRRHQRRRLSRWHSELTPTQ